MVEQIWLVTGCSSGFGEQFVKTILQRGDKVIATARNIDSIQKLRDIGAATLSLDVTASETELKSVIKRAWAIYGRIDVLVQNAGYGTIGTLEDLGNGRLEDQFATNVYGVAKLTRAIMPYWRESHEGHLVLVSSSASWMSSPGLGGYCASKAAIEGLIRTFSEEVKGLGIKTLILQPGSYRTDMRNPAKADFPASSEHNEAMMGKYKAFMANTHGKQGGDPEKFVRLAVDLVKGEGIARGKEVPLSLPVGPDGVASMRARMEQELQTLQKWQEIVEATDYEQGIHSLEIQDKAKGLPYLMAEDVYEDATYYHKLFESVQKIREAVSDSSNDE